MKLRTLFAAALIGAAGFAPAIAADEPQVVRQEMMKKVGGATGAMAKMVKGESDFDAAAALAALTTISEVAATYGEHFPEGSDTGFETEAAPGDLDRPGGLRRQAGRVQGRCGCGRGGSPCRSRCAEGRVRSAHAELRRLP